MTKHEIMKAILTKLDIEPKEEYFSNGSTITADALKSVLEVLVNDGTIDKQDLALTILSSLNIKYRRDFNSNGSTVTKACLTAIYEAL